MLGSDVPDLSTTPCAGCAEAFTPDADVVWDPWAEAEARIVALPYHRACAAAILPPAEPTPDMTRCGRCQEPIEPAQLGPALEALHARFLAARGSLATPDVVWRVQQRDPRTYTAEHFACLLKAVDR